MIAESKMLSFYFSANVISIALSFEVFDLCPLLFLNLKKKIDKE